MAQHPLYTALQADVAAGRVVLANLRGIRSKLEADISRVDARFSDAARGDAIGNLRGAAHDAAKQTLGVGILERLEARAAEGNKFDKYRYFRSGRFESPAAAAPKLSAADGTTLPPILNDSDRLVSARLGQVVESVEALRWVTVVPRLTNATLLDTLRDCIAAQLWSVIPIIVQEADFRASTGATSGDRALAVDVKRMVEAIQVAECDGMVIAFEDCQLLGHLCRAVVAEIADGPRAGVRPHEDEREEKVVLLRRRGATNDEIRAVLAA